VTLKKLLLPLCALLLLLSLVQSGFPFIRGAKKAHTNMSLALKAPPALVEQIARDNEDVKQCVQEQFHGSAAELAKEVDAEERDLNRDGKPEFLIVFQGACGGAANGPVFVYGHSAKGYAQLLEDTGQDFTAKKTSTNGYADLQVGAHSSAVERELTIYKFSRGKYRISECITQTYVGKRRGRDVLRFNRHNCSDNR
jgi:hypothetical protein